MKTGVEIVNLRSRDQEGLTKEEFFKLLKECLDVSVWWSIRRNQNSVMVDGFLKESRMNHPFIVGGMKTRVLRLEFVSGEDLIIAEVALHLDWETIHSVEIKHGKKTRITFRMGVGDTVTLSSLPDHEF